MERKMPEKKTWQEVTGYETPEEYEINRPNLVEQARHIGALEKKLDGACRGEENSVAVVIGLVHKVEELKEALKLERANLDSCMKVLEDILEVCGESMPCKDPVAVVQKCIKKVCRNKDCEEAMKFILTMKDPDGVFYSINKAAQSRAEEQGLDRDQLVEKLDEALRRWCEFGEYIRIEIDLDAGTAKVLEVDR
jgi:hypothetical protein